MGKIHVTNITTKESSIHAVLQFSKRELSLEQIENIVNDIENGLMHEGFSLEHQLLSSTDDNAVNAMNELVGEGDSVCFLLKEGKTVSLIGYQK